MTKHAVFVSDDAVAPVPAAAAGRHSSFPPPRAAGCRKLAAAAQIDLAAAGVARIGSWLDSMKASSPRHGKPVSPAAGTGAVAIVAAAGDSDREEWMEKHPSALARFEAVLAAAAGKQIVMFLDYDGTLSPIVEDPDRAVMTEEMRDAVRGVAEHFPTAIVSGRCRDKVFNFVKLADLYYAGSHGMDIEGPTAESKHIKAEGKAVLYQPASEFLPMIDEVYAALTATMESIPGARVEDNKFCLSVHFRCVDEKKWDDLALQVRSVLKEYPELRLTQGRKVLEIRPAIKWDKGKALEFLLEHLGYAKRNDVFPIYIGDDRTDEDAFKVLHNMGHGVGILVSKFPKETNASYTLREPTEVKEFLRELVKSKI